MSQVTPFTSVKVSETHAMKGEQSQAQCAVPTDTDWEMKIIKQDKSLAFTWVPNLSQADQSICFKLAC